jgi:hypothetical protein
MSEERNWKRIRERLALHLPVRVRVRETPDFEWTEMTRLVNVTPFGAGFTLRRPTEKGRLLHMTIPMPRQLRVFDHVEEQYRVWAIVRYLRSESTADGIVFNLGVAFIGKRPPASYGTEPWKRYDVANTATEALPAPEDLIDHVPSENRRNETRHKIAVDMRVDLFDENGKVVQTENTVSEDISANGASIFTTLNLHPGRFIRLTSEQYRVTLHAAIRSQRIGPDGITRIHVEFIDKEWPL